MDQPHQEKKLHAAASDCSRGDDEPSAQCVCQMRIEQDQDYYVLLWPVCDPTVPCSPTRATVGEVRTPSPTCLKGWLCSVNTFSCASRNVLRVHITLVAAGCYFAVCLQSSLCISVWLLNKIHRLKPLAWRTRLTYMLRGSIMWRVCQGCMCGFVRCVWTVICRSRGDPRRRILNFKVHLQFRERFNCRSSGHG